MGEARPTSCGEEPDVPPRLPICLARQKLRRLRQAGMPEHKALELLDTVDRDRIEFVKHYFNADWPTRCLYHLMLNTAVGNENVITTILTAKQTLEQTTSGSI